MPAFNPKASADYFKSVANTGRRGTPVSLTDDLIRECEELREEIRAEEGGGGMCHFVTEVLQARYGWDRQFVTYLTPEGEIICGGGHVVSILPDGSVLDPTRDQFGEGHSVSLLRPDDEEIGRYRPEFYEDFHPGHPDAEGLLDGWADAFAGEFDTEIDDLNRRRLKEHWWLNDRSLIESYLAQQEIYSQSRSVRMRS